MKREFYKSRNFVESFLKFLGENITVIVYDCETTGLSPDTNHIIQLHARKCFVSNKEIEEAECRNWYINPGYALPDKIVELTGITDEFLEDKPREEDVIDEIVEFFGNEPVCGYNNIKFDDKFLENLFARYGYEFDPEDSLDVYLVIRDIVDPGETENRKLQTITEYFGFAEQINQFHNAEGDTMATMLCFNRCISLCREKENDSYQNRITCIVKSVAKWQNPRNWKQQRVYVETDNATFWFDTFEHTWNTKQENGRICQYDIEDVIKQTLSLTGLTNEEELAGFNGKVKAS